MWRTHLPPRDLSHDSTSTVGADVAAAARGATNAGDRRAAQVPPAKRRSAVSVSPAASSKGPNSWRPTHRLALAVQPGGLPRGPRPRGQFFRHVELPHLVLAQLYMHLGASWLPPTDAWANDHFETTLPFGA